MHKYELNFLSVEKINMRIFNEIYLKSIAPSDMNFRYNTNHGLLYITSKF